MSLRSGVVALLAAAILLPACASAPPVHVTNVPGTVAVISEGLLPSYILLMRESKTFRAAMREIEKDGFRLVIGYQNDFETPYPDPVFGGVAGVDPLLHPSGKSRYYGANIVFFTREVEAAAREAGVSAETITRELAVVLAHEIYGHVVPSAAPRLYPSPCADPAWDAVTRELGCAGERENVIRAELGFPLRPRYLHLDLTFFCAVKADVCAEVNSRTIVAQTDG